MGKRQEISQLTGINATQQYDKYLGLPILVGNQECRLLRVSKIGCGIASLIGKISFYLKSAKRC
jgi:hypothetical protein